MGTRAAFWIGNPQELDRREWLGCKAWDGYPEAIVGDAKVETEQEFRDLVAELSKERDFAHPTHGWPYPWDDDIFLTDYTYAFFDGALRVTCFHTGFSTLPEHETQLQNEEDLPDTLPDNVPAPKLYDRGQPDSIMIVAAP